MHGACGAVLTTLRGSRRKDRLPTRQLSSPFSFLIGNPPLLLLLPPCAGPDPFDSMFSLTVGVGDVELFASVIITVCVGGGPASDAEDPVDAGAAGDGEPPKENEDCDIAQG